MPSPPGLAMLSDMTSELQLFVKEALEKRLSRAQIQETLLRAGWQADEVGNALDAYADVDFPIAVPRRKPYLSAREAFLYLVLFLTLYISAFSTGSLLFDFINHFIPDPLTPYDATSFSAQSIRTATASLIITFPLFLFVSHLLGKAIRRDPEKRGSKVRKWLTYLTLFIAAGIIIGDLITLVSNLLSGELSIRFILKVLTVLLIAGSIFGYYLWDLRQEEDDRPRASII